MVKLRPVEAAIRVQFPVGTPQQEKRDTKKPPWAVFWYTRGVTYMSIEQYKKIWEEFRATMNDLEHRRTKLFTRISKSLDEQRIATLRQSIHHDHNKSKK